MFRFALFAIVLIPCFGQVARAGAPQRRPPPRSRSQKPRVPPKPKINYALFSHQTHVVTQKLECGACHKVPSKNWKEVRKGDAAFADVTDFPEHATCLNCHRTQFFARERPAPVICANCHLAVTPRDTARWLFPSLGDLTDPKLRRRELVSEFAVGFPHDKHLDVVGFNRFQRKRDPLFVAVSLQKKDAPPASCPVCHQTYQPQGNSSDEYVTKPPKNLGDNFWLKKGTFKTIPTSHSVCFTCHNADSGIAPDSKDCNVCHKLSPSKPTPTDWDAKLAASMGADKFMLARWNRRTSAGAFRHEGGEHPDLSCLNCHQVDKPTFSTLDLTSMKVSVNSCGGADGCHITQTTEDGGALNYEIDSKKKEPKFLCTKCHVTFGSAPTPESHAKAIPTPKPKKTS